MSVLVSRVSRLEQAREPAEAVQVCHRYGPEDDENIRELEKEARKAGQILVVIQGFGGRRDEL